MIILDHPNLPHRDTVHAFFHAYMGSLMTLIKRQTSMLDLLKSWDTVLGYSTGVQYWGTEVLGHSTDWGCTEIHY